MKTTSGIVGEIKTLLQDTAFLVAQGAAAKTVHSKLMESLELISSLEVSADQQGQPELSDKEATEVRKVTNRLNLWARRPAQINTRILSAYLKLRREGCTSITEDMLRRALPKDISFQSNFAQMKTIAQKNHGKIFDQNGELVTLWKPIEWAALEFEKRVT